MAVFAISTVPGCHSPGCGYRTAVQTGGGAGHAQERKHKVDHRVLSTNPKPIKLPYYTHDANPRPRRTSQI